MSKRELLRRIVKFGFTGLSGLLVDTAVLWMLSKYLLDCYALEYILAPAISFEFAVINNYTISYLWVWKERTKRKWRDYIRRLPGYNLTTVFAFIIKLLILILTERIFHLDVLICNIIAVFSASIINFLAGDKIIFRNKSNR